MWWKGKIEIEFRHVVKDCWKLWGDLWLTRDGGERTRRWRERVIYSQGRGIGKIKGEQRNATRSRTTEYGLNNLTRATVALIGIGRVDLDRIRVIGIATTGSILRYQNQRSWMKLTCRALILLRERSCTLR